MLKKISHQNAKLLLVKEAGEKKERESSPTLSLQSSDHYINGAGFIGIDVEVHDCGALVR